MKKVLINLVTHSSYIDVCRNFLYLYNKNWNSNNYDFSISIIGDYVELSDNVKIYNYGNVSLPSAIYKTVIAGDYDYCISFLGDAFIYKKVNENIINSIMKAIDENKIEYCNLIPHPKLRFKSHKINNYMRLIENNDSYNMSFVAFIANKSFIMKEFENEITDLEFERKYLQKSSKSNFIYNNRVILTKNIFNITPGIDAGKWNLHSLKKIRKYNPEIVLCKRPLTSKKIQLKNDFIKLIQTIFKRKTIKRMKKIANKIFKISFVTND